MLFAQNNHFKGEFRLIFLFLKSKISYKKNGDFMKKYFCEFCNKNVNTKIEHKKITVNYEYIDSETEMPEIKKVPVK